MIGSGVTGVEFMHMFTSLGCRGHADRVSRQQVLPPKDPEVAAVLEDEFLGRGVKLLKGARADRHRRATDDGVARRAATTAASAEGSHALLAIGSIPNTEGLGLDAAGVEVDGAATSPVNHHCQTNVPHIYAAGDLSGKLPLSSVAAMQGRKIAEHVMGLHTPRAPPPRLRQGGVGDLHRARDRRRRASPRPRRSPRAARSGSPRCRSRRNAKALINGDPRGFVKILSDPATGVVLGGSIVGRHAAELISVIAVAVTNGLQVADIVESLLVHPALAEALADAAE